MPDSFSDPRDQQATACLHAAETHRAPLLALARKLAGTEQGGMDLFQEACLNCHDAIQRWGFPRGDRYEFYLRAAIKHQHYKEQKHAHRHVSLNDFQRGDAPSLDELQEDAWGFSPRHRVLPDLVADPDAPESEYDVLAHQVQEEIRASFSHADRIAFRLHVDGESYRDIAALVGGGDHSWISRRVAKMKTALRTAFGQAWANLHAE